MHPTHFIDSLVIPRIVQVLPLLILLTLGFKKAALAAATAAAELLRVVMVVNIFCVRCHIFVRAWQKTKLRTKCTTDDQKFGAKI